MAETQGTAGHLRGLENSVRRGGVLAWTVLLVGIGVVFLERDSIGGLLQPDPFRGVGVKEKRLFNDLLGRTINLPLKDVDGKAINLSGKSSVLALDCFTCGDPERLLLSLRRMPDLPIVVLVDSASGFLKANEETREAVRIVEYASCSPSPTEVFELAPLAFTLERGRITRVQSEEQFPEAYLGRGID